MRDDCTSCALQKSIACHTLRECIVQVLRIYLNAIAPPIRFFPINFQRKSLRRMIFSFRMFLRRLRRYVTILFSLGVIQLMEAI